MPWKPVAAIVVGLVVALAAVGLFDALDDPGDRPAPAVVELHDRDGSADEAPDAGPPSTTAPAAEPTPTVVPAPVPLPDDDDDDDDDDEDED